MGGGDGGGGQGSLWRRCRLVLGSLDAAADSAKRARICLPGSPRGLACQSAGRLSTLFLNQHLRCPVGWAGGGCDGHVAS